MASIDPAAFVAACRRNEAARRWAVVDPLPLPRRPPADVPDRLRIVVLLSRSDVCGGTRVLCEHASRLADRGHQVTVVGHGPRPDWTGLRAGYVRVPHGTDLVDGVPDADVLVAHYWDQVRAARAATGLPVLHLEQGDFHLYDQVDAAVAERARRCLQAADATLAVSAGAAQQLRERYGVQAQVVGNAVDPEVFHPHGPRPARSRPYVVSVGWDGDAFKGLDVVRAAWEQLGLEVDLVRVSARPPLHAWGEVVVDPPQRELAALLRGAAAFVGGSRYEAWGLPAMEAMASGTPVVSTAHTGLAQFAQDGRDCLLVPVDDAAALAARLRDVLTDQALAQRLRDGGLQTAARWSWDEVVGRVEAALRALAPGPSHVPAGWSVSPVAFTDTDGLARLQRRLAATAAREVQVPVVHEIAGGAVARWTTVARRPQGRGRERLHATATSAAPYGGARASAYRMVLDGRAAQALPGLTAALARARGGEQLVLARWVCLALLKAGQPVQAFEVAVTGLQDAPDHADFARLAAVAAATAGDVDTALPLADVADRVGSGARYDEWFTVLPV